MKEEEPSHYRSDPPPVLAIMSGWTNLPAPARQEIVQQHTFGAPDV